MSSVSLDQRRLVLMFTDMVDSTALKMKLGDRAYVEKILGPHDAIFRAILQDFPGSQEIKNTGDGFLVNFPLVSDAVNAALRFQHELRTYTWGSAAAKTRIGIHVGEAVLISRPGSNQIDIQGHAVDICARVMNLGMGGQILLTRHAYDDGHQFVREHPHIPESGELLAIGWLFHGRYRFKGKEDDPLEVFEVGISSGPFTKPRDSDKGGRVLGAEEKSKSRRRIFVSHSDGDVDSPKYIEAIEEALTRAGFEVLVDRARLEPDAKWRDDIYTWMGLCHGAIILVTEAAKRQGSLWVPKETSVLMWRRSIDPKFIVIPVCVGAVEPDDLTSGVFSEMQLEEIGPTRAASPTALGAVLADRFAFLAATKTPLDVLASRLSELLIGLSEGVIEEAIESLAIDLGPCAPAGDLRRSLALALLQAPLRDSLSALEVLAGCIEGSKADQILSMIAPSWVDLCAARWLAHCGARTQRKPAAVLNASTSFCARMYVDRASCRPPRTRWPIVTSTGVHGERAAEEIAAEVEQNLIHEFRLADDPQVSKPSARLALLLREREREGRPIFVTLPFSHAISSALAELQRLLPSVTFVLLTGEEFPPSALLEGRCVRLVEPRLKPGAEAQAQLDFDYVRSIIRPQGAAVV